MGLRALATNTFVFITQSACNFTAILYISQMIYVLRESVFTHDPPTGLLRVLDLRDSAPRADSTEP
jgi:hypothetical protein